MNTYFQNLKEARKKSGMTQSQVESALEMRSLTIRDYESGRLKLPVKVAIDLANLYQVSLNELLGVEESVNSDQLDGLNRFKSVFVKNRTQLLFIDPVVRAFLEENYDSLLDNSLFEILTLGESEKYRSELSLLLSKLLCSLAAIDGKITNEEISCIDYLIVNLNMESKYKGIKKSFSEIYMGENLSKKIKRIEIRHFIIWMLFIFASSDEKIVEQEHEYIKKIAENLAVNRSNFIFIKDKFKEF